MPAASSYWANYLNHFHGASSLMWLHLWNYITYSSCCSSRYTMVKYFEMDISTLASFLDDLIADLSAIPTSLETIILSSSKLAKLFVYSVL